VRRIFFEKRLLLPGSSTKRYSFVVPIEKSYRPLRIAVLQDGDRLAEETIDLQGRRVSDRIVLGLSREASLDVLSVLSTNAPHLETPERSASSIPWSSFFPPTGPHWTPWRP